MMESCAGHGVRINAYDIQSERDFFADWPRERGRGKGCTAGSTAETGRYPPRLFPLSPLSMKKIEEGNERKGRFLLRRFVAANKYYLKI